MEPCDVALRMPHGHGKSRGLLERFRVSGFREAERSGVAKGKVPVSTLSALRMKGSRRRSLKRRAVLPVRCGNMLLREASNARPRAQGAGLLLG